MTTAIPATFPPRSLDQAGRRFERATGREQVVDDEHALAHIQGVHMHLHRAGAVFEIVRDRVRLEGKLDSLVKSLCRPN